MNCQCIRRERPWGWFETIERGDQFKVKRIFVNPNQRFSLQYHNYRQEHWIILKGDALAMVNNYEEWVSPGKHFHIPVNSRHRITAGDKGVLFIEIQHGECREDDLVRLEDDYGRIDMHEYYTE